MAEHPGITAGLKVDGFAIFKGYSSDLEEGQVAVLSPEDPVKIVRFEGESDVVVVKVDDDGNEVKIDGQPVAERCFPEELEPAVNDAEEETAEVAAEEPAGEADAGEEAGEAEEPAGDAAEEPAAEAEAEPAAEAPAKATRARKPAAAKAEEAAPAAEEKPKGRVRKAAEPAAAAKDEVKSTPVVEIADMASVKDAMAEAGGDALKAAKALVERAERTDFTLGGVLRNINESGVFKTLGFDGKRGFDDYVEQTLGVASRKARYLMGIYTKFALLGVDESKLDAIGWSKAKELARIDDAELKRDFNKLVKKAEGTTREKLIEHIKSTYAVATRGNAETVKLTDFKFRLAEEDAKTATDALAAASQMTGEPNDLNKAFLYIMGEWANTGAGQNLDIEQALELMGSRFNLQSISFTDANGEVLEWTPEEAGAEAEEVLPETATA